ncbi:peptidyl-prolyl cis-trans isomerase [Roseibium album]|uniref:peptidylprolyl isomerase n=1 Tax=Roseibium album TaxID=311410 RepID=UPI003BAF68DC
MFELRTKTPFWREPLFHFLILGGLVFAADAFFASARKEQIIVDQSTIDYLVARQENIELRDIAPSEVEDLIATHVEDEILYREAYKRGLNEGDSRMRRNMILKMRGLLVAELDTPTEQQLKDFFQDSTERYTSEEQFQVDHVFFREEASIPDGLLEQLDQGADFRSVSERYTPTFGRSSVQATRSELVEIFGREAGLSVVNAKPDAWMGPFSSSNGIHFVRRTGLIPPQLSKFEDVEPYLLMDWQSEEARKLIEVELETVRDDYDVLVGRE